MTYRPGAYAWSLILLVFAAQIIWAQGIPGAAEGPPPASAVAVDAASREPSRRSTPDQGRDPQIPPRAGEWALVWGPWEAGGWTDVLSAPRRDAHRIGQALLGDRVEIKGLRGEWAKTREWGNAWQGWVRSAHLTYGSRRVRKAFASMPAAFLAAAPYLEIDRRGNRAPFGAHLPLAGKEGARLVLRLPDGRKLKVSPADIAPASQPKPVEFALLRARGLLRRPFQLGANSPEAMDGAGLIYLLLRASGREVPREPVSLWRQTTVVRRRALQPGDVLFFEAFGGQPPRPAILVADEVLLEASPASGVNFVPLTQLAQRRLLEVRRFRGQPLRTAAASWTAALSPAFTSSPLQDLELLLLLVMATSHQMVLLAFLLLLRSQTAGRVVAGSDADLTNSVNRTTSSRTSRHRPDRAFILRIAAAERTGLHLKRE